MGVMVTSFNLLHRTIQCSVSARKFPRGCLKTRSSQNALERMFLRSMAERQGNILGRGVVAQWLEHLLCKQDVEGSSPFDSTIF